MHDPERQREFATEIVSHLRAEGFQAYWAGGCVRDQLLGRTPKDYDVATNATPPQIQNVFHRRKTLEIGAAFGVIAVIGPRPAGTVEVTTFRRDAHYHDGRRPQSVSFTTAEEDATRRDFTINGLFFDPVDERVLDYVGGVNDLNARLVRAIGDPRERFREDKLRMLRAIRMAATLDFEFDPTTWTAVSEMADQVTTVSAERIAQEMRQMLEHGHRRRAIELLLASGLLKVILPEAAELGSALGQTLAMLQSLERPSFSLALAVLLESSGPHPAARAEGVALRWKLSNKEEQQMIWLLEHATALNQADQRPWSHVQPLLVHEGIEELMEFHATRARVLGAETADLDYCREKLKLAPAELNPPPLVSGHDLIRHGVPRGSVYAKLLDKLRAAQLDGQVETKETALAQIDRWLASGELE
jgi:poly(A) polymerase